MEIKKSLLTLWGFTLLIAIGAVNLLKMPFRLLRWGWRHKVASALILAAGFFGYKGVHAAYERRSIRRQLEEQVLRLQQVDVNDAPGLDIRHQRKAAEAILRKPLIAVPERPASVKRVPSRKGKSVLKEKLGKSSTAQPNITDWQSMPVFDRLDNQMNQDLSKVETDQAGVCTIVVCQTTNMQNAVAIRLGYIATPEEGPRRYQIYQASLVSDKGYSPITTKLNVSFKGTDIRFGLLFDKDGVKTDAYDPQKTTVAIDGQDGRELWMVRDGCLKRETKPQTVNIVYNNLNLEQTGDLYVVAYKAPACREPVIVNTGREM